MPFRADANENQGKPHERDTLWWLVAEEKKNTPGRSTKVDQFRFPFIDESPKHIVIGCHCMYL